MGPPIPAVELIGHRKHGAIPWRGGGSERLWETRRQQAALPRVRECFLCEIPL